MTSPQNTPVLPMYFVNTTAQRIRMAACIRLDSIGIVELPIPCMQERRI